MLATVVILFPGETIAADNERVELELAGGDRLRGVLMHQNDQVIALEHPDLGSIELPMGRITAVRRLDEVQPRPAGRTFDQESDALRLALGLGPAATESFVPDPGIGVLDGPPIVELLEEPGVPDAQRSPWRLRVDLAVHGSSGRTEEIRLRSSGRLTRECERSLTRFDGRYLMQDNRRKRTRDEITAGAFHEWKLPDSPWTVFVWGRYEYDFREDWRHRLGGTSGVGYGLIDRSDLELTLRVGAGAMYELYGGGGLGPEGLVAVEGVWRINSSMDIAAVARYIPEFESDYDHRIQSNLEWSIRLLNDDHWRLRLGIEHEYSSKPARTRDRNDLRYYLAIGLDF